MGNCLKGEREDDDVSLLRSDGDEEGAAVSNSDPPPYHEIPPSEPQPVVPVYHLTPSQSRPASQLTEDEQVKIAQRIGLIQHLPESVWDDALVQVKKARECCICMMDFEQGEPIRYLPCMHFYHMDCIDSWLMRSFTCPSCMEPVDGALLTSYGHSDA